MYLLFQYLGKSARKSKCKVQIYHMYYILYILYIYIYIINVYIIYIKYVYKYNIYIATKPLNFVQTP